MNATPSVYERMGPDLEDTTGRDLADCLTDCGRIPENEVNELIDRLKIGGYSIVRETQRAAEIARLRQHNAELAVELHSTKSGLALSSDTMRRQRAEIEHLRDQIKTNETPI